MVNTLTIFMKIETRKFAAEFKVQVLSEYLDIQIAVNKICVQLNFNLIRFNLWKKTKN